MPSGVAWTLQVSYLCPTLTEAISLQSTLAESALEVQPKSKTETLLRGEGVTRYRPPGTMKMSDMALLIRTLIILVARGRSGSLRCCFSNAPQSSIHLRGAIAVLSRSKTLMSDMGKLGRKRVLSRPSANSPYSESYYVALTGRRFTTSWLGKPWRYPT